MIHMRDYSVRYPEPEITKNPEALLEGWFGKFIIVAAAVCLVLMFWSA